jgi:peptidoglycan-associated lipoprotein
MKVKPLIFSNSSKFDHFRNCTVALALLSLAACSSTGASGSADSRAAMAYPGSATKGTATQDAFFSFDASTLSEKGKEALAISAVFLKQNPSEKYTLEGHCDERGTDEYNLALGEQRAKSAYDYLRSLGVPSGQIKILSYGEERPFVEGMGEAVWSQNRRVHFAPK